MFPKEHGAYGQLLFPIATTLAIGHVRLPAVALALAACAAFIAHEPLLVLIGQRGPRAARDQRGRAWRWFGVSATASVVFGIIAVTTSPPSAWGALLVTGFLSVCLGVFIATGREHTLPGETCMSVTMGSLAAPVALAADVPMHIAITIAGAFAAAFVAPTVAVHAVIAFTRKPPAVRTRLVSVVVTVAAAVAAGAAALQGIIATAGPWAATPACVAAIALAVNPPSARRLRVVGWTLVATSTAAAAILIASLSSA